MKCILFLLMAFFSLSSQSQIKLTRTDSAHLPNKLKYTGHLLNAVKWTDSLGENTVITSGTGAVPCKTLEEDGYRDAAIYAYHYLTKGDSTKLVWRIYDFISECPVDLDLYFIDKTFAVTDLDKNGIAEVWVMYRNSCHGDVSPVPTKIIMYEGNKKYALRGTSKVKVSATAYMGGEFSLDENFKTGNPLFKTYAEKLWSNNKVEK